jgi:hypothetical protein
MAGAPRVPHPELRELLFADLDPATARQRFGAVESLRTLADAAVAGDRRSVAAGMTRVLGDRPETRTRLQAFTIARAAGVAPPPDEADVARGVIVDMGFDEGTDTLAGYEDGSARYFNHAGAAVIWDARGDADIGLAIRALLEAGQAIAEATGLLEGRRPGPPDAGTAAIWVLTDAGIHAGIGPAVGLSSSPLGEPIIDAAVRLMTLLMDRSESAGR